MAAVGHGGRAARAGIHLFWAGGIGMCLLLTGCATSRAPAPLSSPAPVVTPAPTPAPDATPAPSPAPAPEVTPARSAPDPGPRRPAAPGLTGDASWYGKPHHGRQTASGERFDMHEMTAAHPTLALGTRVLVTNLTNGRSVEVRINDRGPVVKGRIIDLSYAAARELGAVSDGVIPVRLKILP